MESPPSLAQLIWKSSISPPDDHGIMNAQAVWKNDRYYVTLEGKLYVRNAKSLFIYHDNNDVWELVCDMPGRLTNFALITYHSQPMIVGGRSLHSGQNLRSDKFFVLDQDNRWNESPLPPLLTKRYSASAVSKDNHIIVAGGFGDSGPLSTVEVYDGQSWSMAHPLPKACYLMKSILHGGYWYLMGGEGQDKEVYCASLTALITSASSSSGLTKSPDSVWKRIKDVPFDNASPAVFENRLIVTGPQSQDIYSYSFDIQSWELYATMSPNVHGTRCTVVLPSGELMVLSDGGTYKASKRSIIDSDHRGESLHQENTVLKEMNALLLEENSTLKAKLDDLQKGAHKSSSQVKELTQSEAVFYLDTLNSEQLLKLGEKLGLHKSRLKTMSIDEIVAAWLRQEDNVKDISGPPDWDTLKKAVKEVIHSQVDLSKTSDVLSKTDKESDTTIASIRDISQMVQELKTEVKGLKILKQLVPDRMDKIHRGEGLRGVDVCGESTVIVTNSSSDFSFHWKGYGLKLHFPEHCLPAGTEQCIIKIQASLAGQYAFSENCHLVSAVYWLRCEPSCKFTKPISVEMQHCAQLKNVSKLSFVRSLCTQKQLPYTFKKIGGTFTKNSSMTCGLVQVDSFSGLGIIQEVSEPKDPEREYCSILYYLERAIASCVIHFVFVWNTEAHLTTIKNYYEEKGGREGTHMIVLFEEDTIHLDIPSEGLHLPNNWTISQLTPAIVVRNIVDRFRPTTLVPSCQFYAEYPDQGSEQRIPTLLHNVKLCGAKQPYDNLTMKYNPQEDRVAQTTVDSKARRLDQEKETLTLQILLSELIRSADHWAEIGALLGIEDTRIRSIQRECSTNHQSCLREMLSTWLRTAHCPKWLDVVNALEYVGDIRRALDLKEKYCLT